MQTTEPVLQRLVDRVRDASARHQALDIRGGGTKRFYGGEPVGEPLDVRELGGISCYDPSELVVTVRAGTPLADLEAALAERGQCLPFEPPRFAPGGTVGGMVAAGLAGPSRAAVGGIRDYTLGLTLLSGDAEVLSFGGQVMKNVAGYDVSRLLPGSLGVLGVICEVSLKVLPVRTCTRTLEFDLAADEALAFLGGLAAQPLPVHASAWHAGRLRLRLSGARAAVATAEVRLGGRPQPDAAADDWWSGVRDHRHPFFVVAASDLARGIRLWRLSVPPRAPAITVPGEQFIEWQGAQRWMRTDAPAEAVRAAAAAVGGHASLIRGADRAAGVFAPLPPAMLRIQREVKRAFDPQRIFNPGRLYADL
jgi:FAD/FMN-containing dehydrogenase